MGLLDAQKYLPERATAGDPFGVKLREAIRDAGDAECPLCRVFENAEKARMHSCASSARGRDSRDKCPTCGEVRTPRNPTLGLAESLCGLPHRRGIVQMCEEGIELHTRCERAMSTSDARATAHRTATSVRDEGSRVVH